MRRTRVSPTATISRKLLTRAWLVEVGPRARDADTIVLREALTYPMHRVPLCRHHHRCKQAEGWQLTQPEPGVLIWRTPAGRTYATRPTQYPV